jgi:hypothetical protein
MQQESYGNEAKLRQSEAGNSVLRNDFRSAIMTRNKLLRFLKHVDSV